MTFDLPSDVVADEREPVGGQAGRSFLAAHGLSWGDVWVLAAAVVLVAGWFPPLFFDNWTLRLATLLPLGVVGGVQVAAAAAGRDRAAIAGVVLVLWAGVVSALADAPRTALVGTVGRETSWMTLALSVGVWGAGRSLSPAGRRWLPPVLAGALSIGALVGVLQVALRIEGGTLALYAGRPAGLVENPVFYGALCAGGSVWGVAALASRDLSARSRDGAALGLVTVVCGVGAAVSGSRVAVASCIVLAMTIGATRRSLGAAAGSAAMVVGLAAGAVLSQTRAIDADVGSRLASADGGGRSTVWGYGLRAWLDRPLQGYGVGAFRVATQGRFDIEFVARHAADERRQPWFDPHNIVIALLVSVGVVGLVLAMTWVATAAARARGPLVWAAAAIALTWLLQPIGLATMPVALLALGAAVPSSFARRGPRVRTARWFAAAAAAVVALLLVVADQVLAVAADRFDSDLAVAAARIYGRDPVVADLVAQISQLDADASAERSLAWRVRATAYEPDRPLWWIRLAQLQIDRGDIAAAETSLLRAESLQPNNVGAVRARLALAAATDDRAGFDLALADACELEMAECETLASVSESGFG